MHRRELNQLLETYALDSGEEAQAAEMFRSLLEEPGDIFSRSHFVPGHVTASAVVLSESGDQIALIDHPKLEKWLQPGGHVEAVDQSLIAAAHREVIEECGPLELQFDGLIDLDVHRIGRYDQEPTHQHFDARFLCRVTGGSLAHTGEVRAVRWWRLDDPPWPIDRSLERLITKARGL